MSKNMKNILKIIPFLFLPVIIFSCVREESETGIQLQDPNTIINGHRYDSAKVDISTVYADSSYTQKLSTVVIGYYKDNHFGSVNASVFTQIQFENQKKPDLSGAQSFDSLILSLAFAGYFPKTYDTNSSGQIHIQVYQLSDNLDKDKNYKPDDVVSFNESSPLWDGNVAFNPTKSLTIDGNTESAQIRIPMPEAFRDYIAKTNWSSNEDFINTLKGLHIRVKQSDEAGNKMGYFNLNSANSGLTLFYKDAEGARQKTRYVVDTSLVRFSNFTHDYSGTALANIKTQDIPGNSKIYLENLLGTRIKVNFPDLISWGRNKPYAINQAVLVLPVTGDIDEANIQPGVYCYAYNAEGKIAPVLDSYSSSGIVMSYYDSDKKAYRILLTRHIQNMLNGNYENWGFLLIPYAEKNTASRVILNGSDFASSGAHLEIIYTAPPVK